jgi:hypothetical protein
MCDEDGPVNDGEFHEVMDRAALVVDLWVDSIQGLRATHEHPRLKTRADEVAQILADFYGLAGEVYFDRLESSKSKQCTGEGRFTTVPGVW